MSGRALAIDRIRAHYANLETERTAETHVIPAAKMTEFLSYNQATLHDRPNPDTNQVRWDREALARFRKQLEPHAESLTHVLPEDWPSLMTLWNAYESQRIYIPFDEMLRQLTHVVYTVCYRALQAREENPNVLILLALPDNVVDKSYLWLILYCWDHVPLLRQTVDFIIPAMVVTRTMFGILNDKQWTGQVLYIDDMTYSGKQVQMFLTGDGDAYDQERILFTPCVGYATQRALDLCQGAYARDTFDMTVPYRTVRTPGEYLKTRDEITTKVLDEFSRLPRRYRLPDTVAKDVIVQAFPTKVAPSDEQREALLLYYRLTQPMLPVILFEHKLADSWSISHSFLYVLPEPECLVRVGGKPATQAFSSPENGSSAFYKGVEWFFELRGERLRIPDATLIRSFFMFHMPTPLLRCANCGSDDEKLSVCSPCGTTLYCDPMCQAQHYDEHQTYCARHTHVAEGQNRIESMIHQEMRELRDPYGPLASHS